PSVRTHQLRHLSLRPSRRRRRRRRSRSRPPIRRGLAVAPSRCPPTRQPPPAFAPCSRLVQSRRLEKPRGESRSRRRARRQIAKPGQLRAVARCRRRRRRRPLRCPERPRSPRRQTFHHSNQ
ncbi:Os12g0175800, partial [Oryza sativa Japonica Group]